MGCGGSKQGRAPGRSTVKKPQNKTLRMIRMYTRDTRPGEEGASAAITDLLGQSAGYTDTTVMY